MGDTLEEPWWESAGQTRQRSTNSSSDRSDDESLEEATGPSKVMKPPANNKPVSSKKRKQHTECFPGAEEDQSKDKKEGEGKPKKRRKKISDILAQSAPKPGTPEDVKKLLKEHFGAKRSVIELEELKLPDACFLPPNDLTHSFSSYLKEICPKWAKLRKNHKEKKSVVMLIICSSALRCLELIKSMTAFKGEGKVMKLFAKHLKIQEQSKILEKDVIHVGVGTPGRIKVLIEQDSLSLAGLKYVILDWNWRDQKLRRLVDIPEIRKESIDLLEIGLIKLCREGSVKLGLF
ncbi:protein CMSS1 isoform X2 [Sphaerodactylus townsendi]|uniref:protein CMSS1 isoform X2 n=1 Tax=Sphaerodactylus townsendi TaxID=933632 RepID=UPI002026E2E5|nr:protein CMSS1 isoform X2 [Sphaerodactylus townsendi]